MSIVSDEKEVRFDIYCPLCEHKDLKEEDYPCDECLAEPTNTHSIKPVNFKEKRR